jgi:tetratricopeptide (TPR) repeat protein
MLLAVCACCHAALIDAAPPGDGPPGDAHLLEVVLARRDALWEQALHYRAAGTWAEAIAAAEQVLAIERKHLGDAHAEVLHTQEFLAELHEAREDYAAARRARQQVFEMLQEVCGPLDWRVVDARLACEHVDLLERLTADRRRQLRQADALNARMASLYAEGKYAESIEAGRRALEIRQELLGDDHPATAESLNNLALLAKSVGAYEQARKLYDRAVSIRRTVLGEQHPDYAESLSNLATLHHSLGEYEEAEPLLREALRITQAAMGEEHAV